MNQRMLELTTQPDADGRCILYVMSRDQRVADNHALLEAQAEALKHTLPLAVVFNIYHQLGNRRREHFEFMIQGLKEVEVALGAKNIPFILSIGTMSNNIAALASQLRPRSIYVDFSPLRHARSEQKKLASTLSCRVVVVDTHNVIPVWVTSDKEEFAAHTIRRKLHKHISDWAIEPATIKKHVHSFERMPIGASWDDVTSVIAQIPKSGINHEFMSGEKAAHAAMRRFIDTGLVKYAAGRNDASIDAQSDLSPYLHFGQISTLRILLDTMNISNEPPQLFTAYTMPGYEGNPTHQDGMNAFIEELIVRKELSDNFCFYNPHYDSLEGARNWAKQTLDEHKTDPREFIYTKQQLESAHTHDELWNAAQRQLLKSGKMHGYMRMYWAKKILEWTESPQTAIAWAIELNDTYHLDGGDPNGYVGILWSIAGVHDRPWFNRSVYGTIRYMNANGAKNKFNTARYIERWSA